MAGYTKLFSSIITSSVWSEDDKTRIMWITMLAICDAAGHVDGAVPGLADVARMSIPDAEAAILKLESPDPYSRTPDNDGRRIRKEIGGWRILNHGLFRERLSEDDRREYKRRWDRENRPSGHARSRPQPDNSPTQSDNSPTQSDTVRFKPDRSDTRQTTDTDTNDKPTSSLDRWSSVVRSVVRAFGEDRGHHRLLDHIANSLTAAPSAQIEEVCDQIESLLEESQSKDNPAGWFQAAASKHFGHRNGEAKHGKRR